MKLVAMLASIAFAASDQTLPSVYTIVEDDYPYQCPCKCEEIEKPISVCEFDKTTPCYCDVVVAST